MKRLSLYLFLVFFSLQTPSQADDIRDFQIEGISIGDSALDYFSEKELKKMKSTSDRTKKKTYMRYCFDSKVYKNKVCFYITKNDKSYIIKSISGHIKFPNDIAGCYKLQNEVDSEIKEIFTNSMRNERTYKHSGDKSGKTKEKDIIYKIKSGAEAGTACIDYGKEYGTKYNLPDSFQVFLDSKEYAKYLKTAW